MRLRKYPIIEWWNRGRDEAEIYRVDEPGEGDRLFRNLLKNGDEDYVRLKFRFTSKMVLDEAEKAGLKNA